MFKYLEAIAVAIIAFIYAVIMKIILFWRG